MPKSKWKLLSWELSPDTLLLALEAAVAGITVEQSEPSPISGEVRGVSTWPAELGYLARLEEESLALVVDMLSSSCM